MAKFLVTVLCKPERRLPDNYVPSQTDRPVPDPILDTTHLICYTLARAVADAIRELDRSDDVTPEDVTVNPGNLHGVAFNAPDIWVVLDDVGGQHLPRGTANYRRSRIIDALDQAITDVLQGVPEDIYPVIYIGDRSI